ncbi:ATP-binding cassette domain-containing protein [Actinomyces slackii]|uniref:Zinc import ATP-binding protein ZnuC n=1 Tax=Actinomyces slackii TaxID=52774 RepID=A0A3S4U1A9_9ACTO|nr:ATP-binding cassette domain-containing protein [Actinomyces slackii]VEG74041.1 Zinc import ATP-binding protein ZnuC [Actinomyces slackii]
MSATPPSTLWYASLAAELDAVGVAAAEAGRLLEATRAEAEAASADPAAMFGPATLYARELAGALRAAEPARRPLAPAPAPAPEVVLRLRGLTVTRGGLGGGPRLLGRRRRAVLRNVDLELRRGEVVAVVGANGAGKSTLMQVCAGMLAPTAGTVERTGRFGYAPQRDCLSPLLTVDEHLALFGAARRQSRRRSTTTGHRLLSRLGWRARGAQRLGTLSGGTQQKVNLALAQLDAPDLLLLDEPYQGFDTSAYEELWELIDAWRATSGILLVTHLLRDVGLVDRVLELPSPEVDR